MKVFHFHERAMVNGMNGIIEMTAFKPNNFAGKIEIQRELEKVPNRENILVSSLGKCTNFRSNSPMWMACVNMALYQY